MRLFIGIELPLQIKNHIAAFVSQLQTSQKGWENPHDYHMTLLFLGETPLAQIPTITQAMKEISFEPFTLSLKEFAFFNRRILYLGCAPSPELIILKNAIVEKLPQFHQSQEKSFVPHITVKRWQRYEYAELKKGMEENPFQAIDFSVDHLALFKSEKDSDIRKYHLLERT